MSNLNLEIRLTVPADAYHLNQWLSDPSVAANFPMTDSVEIEDAATRWVSFSKYKCSLTALSNGKPIGLATLYLQPYKSLMHQSEFGIIVAPGFRGQGVGSKLLQELIHLAKNSFNIEILHLQVHEGNPAIHLYKRFGFHEFGRQIGWMKEGSSYRARIMMELYT